MPFLDLIAMQKTQLFFAVPVVLTAMSFLWRYLTRKPVTARNYAHAAVMLVAIECWLASANVAYAVYKQKVIALPTMIVLVAALFAIAIGGTLLFERYYPEYPEDEHNG